MRHLRSLVVLLAACSGGSRPPTTTPPTPVAPVAPVAPIAQVTPVAPVAPVVMDLAASGIVPAWLDRSVDPCTDFFAYACGSFLKTAVIPPDRSGWSAILVVMKESEELLRTVLEGAAAAPTPDADTAKLGSYYASCMNEPKIDAAGVTPAKALLELAASAKDPTATAAAITALHAQGITPFFDIGPQQDFMDATKVIVGLDQAGMGLPDRSYYLDAKGSMPRTRAVYAKHVERMFGLAGQAPKLAAASAAAVMRVETALARLAQDKVTRRDPHQIYHRVERAGLEQKVAPTFPWGTYLAGVGLPTATAISVNSTSYFAGVAKLIQTEKPEVLQAYLAWKVLSATASELARPFVEERLVLDKELHGVTALPPRWRTCVNHVDEDLGELLAQSYVKQRFAGDAKARATDLTKAIFAAMRATIDTLSWMDADTRAAAKQKLDKMASLIGYPDKWRQYTFAVARDDFFGNVRAAARFEAARRMAKVGKPVDRFDWQMTPPTVNAYFDGSLNEIVLPAGQLQPPFFGATFHPAVNFGSTGGGTIGHEITHGFDDEGSQFDGDGNLRDWWSKLTKAKFAEATQCVVDQYAAYEAVPKVKLDGKLTAGENIADIGGVKLGYQGYQMWKAAQSTPPPAKVDQYTDDQLYFLAYGQSWCDKRTDAKLESDARSDPHSPPKWRINGVIVNQPGFGAAFGCKVGTPMNPGKQCAVW
ncbi:MAG: M13 family metallopeptidase [Proteobacteria bacterium]|nr:M13 family metallopeptidase [Pseudomonadota bacterium]